jgi:DNA repair protein RadD
VHRRELIRQASDKLDWAGVPHRIIASGFMPAVDELVQVGSLPMIAQRLASLRDFDLVVVDEAHHARADSWRTVLAALLAARLLGVAAGGVFDEIVCGPSIRQLIADGYLSPARCFVPRTRLDLTGVRIRDGDYVAGPGAGPRPPADRR